MATSRCPVDCACHANPFAPCSELGGCGSAGCGRTTPWDPAYCRNGDRCKAFDPAAKHPGHVLGGDTLCDPCLASAERDVRALVYDWLDLAQLQEPSLSQAPADSPGGGKEPPMPLNGGAEALQAEIVHVLSTWEAEVRAAAGLPEPAARVRAGRAVQRAVTVLAPRMRMLSRIAPTAVFPTGCEDEPRDVAGWEAVHHLQRLHGRARGMLGRTRRTRRLPGSCPDCYSDLYQDEPRYRDDECPVRCGDNQCGRQWTYDDYQAWAGDILATPARRKGAAA